jgi:hypothetical protein
VDQAGNLHFFQLTAKEAQITLEHRMWNGSRWVSEEPKNIYIQDRGVPSSVAAAVSSSGDLFVSIVVDYPYLTDEVKTSIIRISKSVQLPAGIKTPEPSLIPTPQLVVTTTEDISGVLQPTEISPILPTSAPASSKNLVGLLLLGGLLALVSIFFLSPFRKRDKTKGPSQ